MDGVKNLRFAYPELFALLAYYYNKNKSAPQSLMLPWSMSLCAAKLRFRSGLMSCKIRLNFEKILVISLASGLKSKETLWKLQHLAMLVKIDMYHCKNRFF